jgi:hypothetical protein
MGGINCGEKQATKEKHSPARRKRKTLLETSRTVG